MRCIDGIGDSVHLRFSKLWELVKHRNAGVLQSMGLYTVGHN